MPRVPHRAFGSCRANCLTVLQPSLCASQHHLRKQGSEPCVRASLATDLLTCQNLTSNRKQSDLTEQTSQAVKCQAKIHFASEKSGKRLFLPSCCCEGAFLPSLLCYGLQRRLRRRLGRLRSCQHRGANSTRSHRPAAEWSHSRYM